MRARFVSAWNGIATIIFFAGIFLGFNYRGFSGILLGIFMWIIGGIVADVIFGPKKKDPRTEFPTRKERRQKSTKNSYEVNPTTDEEFCIACGHRILDGEIYCSNCGTASASSMKKKSI